MGRKFKAPTPPNPQGANRGKQKAVPSAYTASAEELQKKPTRCPFGGCTRILFKGKLAPGTDFEIQCPSCGGYLHTVVMEASN